MKLLTKALRKKIPDLYNQADKEDPIVYTMFFTPGANWKWYVIEFDGKDTFFGLMCGLEDEMGNFSLSELENINGPFGFKILRDTHFNPMPLSQARKY